MLRYWMDEPRGTPMQDSPDGRSLIRTYVVELANYDSPEATYALTAVDLLDEAHVDAELIASVQRIAESALAVVSEHRTCDNCAEAMMRSNEAVGEAFLAHLAKTEAAANELLYLASN